MFWHYVLVKFISRLKLSSLVDVKNYFRNKISLLRKSEVYIRRKKISSKNVSRFDPFPFLWRICTSLLLQSAQKNLVTKALVYVCFLSWWKSWKARNIQVSSYSDINLTLLSRLLSTSALPHHPTQKSNLTTRFEPHKYLMISMSRAKMLQPWKRLCNLF